MKKEALKEIIRLPQHNLGLLFISLSRRPLDLLWLCLYTFPTLL